MAINSEIDIGKLLNMLSKDNIKTDEDEKTFEFIKNIMYYFDQGM
jgi:hypothetical protein